VRKTKAVVQNFKEYESNREEKAAASAIVFIFNLNQGTQADSD
jgi:hypothetical protein